MQTTFTENTAKPRLRGGNRTEHWARECSVDTIAAPRGPADRFCLRHFHAEFQREQLRTVRLAHRRHQAQTYQRRGRSHGHIDQKDIASPRRYDPMGRDIHHLQVMVWSGNDSAPTAKMDQQKWDVPVGRGIVKEVNQYNPEPCL